VLIGMTFASFVVLCVWCLGIVRPGEVEKSIAGEKAARDAVQVKLNKLVTMENFGKAVEDYMTVIEPYDQFHLDRILDKLTDEATDKKRTQVLA